MAKRQYRQGDVLLVQCGEGPLRKLVRPEKVAPVVVAEGEATGHAHVVESGRAKMFVRRRVQHIAVWPDGAVLTHPEHSPIRLGTGVYRVVRQREYVPREEPRWVAD